MQVQTQLSWSQRIAEMICQQSDGEGYHMLSLKRWACVQAMTLMAVAPLLLTALEMERLP
ncbi:hypothetical protein [Paenibacillus pabuli]|uniref:hypothetical protein n=1 Tax=Paenibacillus pabuli TaxID=1472 RepID=UPI003CF3B5A5